MSNSILELKIDNDFKDLIRPLFSEEYKQLEENLLADGCRDPIIVWNGTIIDGHNRYEICSRLNIPFSVVEKQFENKEDVIIWICNNQLGRRNISEETRKYLIGKQYEAKKINGYKRNLRGNNQYMKVDITEPRSSTPKKMEGPKFRTADVVGEEHHISKNTVQKYSTFTRALDTIKTFDPIFVSKVLSGEIKISHDNLIELSHMSPSEMIHITHQMMPKENPIIHYNKSRKIFRTESERRQNDIFTGPSVKDMPQYDPDAEITGLTLTIPSWASSIDRTRSNTNLDVVSNTARNKLIDALNKLQDKVSEMLTAIKED